MHTQQRNTIQSYTEATWMSLEDITLNKLDTERQVLHFVINMRNLEMVMILPEVEGRIVVTGVGKVKEGMKKWKLMGTGVQLH